MDMEANNDRDRYSVAVLMKHCTCYMHLTFLDSIALSSPPGSTAPSDTSVNNEPMG